MNYYRIEELFNTIDRMDTPKFVQFLSPDGSFRFGNFPAVIGRADIAQTVENFFNSISGLKHTLQDVISSGDKMVVTGQVTYTRKDGSTLTVPFCNVFTLRGEEIYQYDIYIDISSLYS
ncbi:MAG: nuclear transport factor 2 family protein [bacterium]